MSKKHQPGKTKHAHQQQHSVVQEWMQKIFRTPWKAAVLAILLATCVVYSFSLKSPTLIVHDESILRQPLISHVNNIPIILSNDFLLFTSGQYRPVSYMLLACVRTFVPVDNLLFWNAWLMGFHALNALLVFALARFVTTKNVPALIAALVFALHPLASILVNNINCFYLVLGLTLSLSVLNLYFLFLHTRNKLYYLCSLVLFVLALGTARQAFVLGFVAIAYEFLSQQKNWKQSALRLSPFIVLPLIALPFCMTLSPHPLHFKYVEVYKGSFFHGLFSFVCATGTYLMGFIFTKGLLAILHETIKQIYSPFTPILHFWSAVDIALIATAAWLLRKRRRSSFGLILAIVFILPYVSVAYNRVVEYISWNYFYFSLVGFAFLLAALYEGTQQIDKDKLRIVGRIAIVALLLFWGGRTVQMNRYVNDPADYWFKALDQNPKSTTALIEVGKAFLVMEQPKYGLHYLFAPMLKDIKNSCLQVVPYYTHKKEFLASAIHLRFGSGKEKTGLVLEPHCKVGSDLLMSAGALDHAEEQLGKLLMVDPYDTEAMGRLAQVWCVKGFVNEAHRLLDRIREFDPQSLLATDLENQFLKMERNVNEGRSLRIDPPSPDWLEYVINQERSPALRRNIIALSNRLTDDPVIQLEATISLLENEEYEKAAQKTPLFIKNMSGFSYACAVACRALATAGKTQEAIDIGLRAISIDSQNQLAWDSLALAHANNKNPDANTEAFMETIAQQPSIAAVYYYNLALQKKKAGENKEAVDLLEKVVSIDPKHFDALLELGRTLVAFRQPERAIQHLEKALTLKTDDPEIYQHLGRGRLMLKQVDRGMEALRTSIKINPKNADYHYILGFALDSIKRNKEANKEYRLAIECNPNHPDSHFKLGNNAFREKDYEKAEYHYRKVAESAPDFEYAHLNLGTVLYYKGKLDEAILEAEEEIEHHPMLADAYNRLIFFYSKNSDNESIRRAASTAKEKGIKLNQESQALIDKAVSSQ